MGLRERDDQYVLETDVEVAFGDGGPFAGAEIKHRVWNAKLETINATPIEDQAYKITSGAHPPINGLAQCQEKGFSFSRYASGTETAAGDGSSPTDTGFGNLLEACFQVDGDATEGDKAAVGWLVSGGDEVTAGAHAHATATTIGLAGFTTPANGIVVRPYTHNVAPGMTFTLLMDLPGAPAQDSIIYGAINYPYTRYWATAGATKSLGMRFKGNSADQHRGTSGCVGTFKIGETKSSDVAVCDFTFQGEDYVDLTSTGAWTRTAPPANLSCVSAGGSCLVGLYGAHASPIELKAASMSFDLGPEYSPDRNPNSSTGIDGWTRKAGMPTAKITIPMKDIPPAAMTADAWRDCVRQGDDSANEIHVLLVWGLTNARRFAIYFPRAIVSAWAPKSIDGIDYQELTISPKDANITAGGAEAAPLVVGAIL